MTAREATLRALYSIEESGAYLNAALKDALSADEFSDMDKGFITELIYGVVGNKSAVDYIISRFSKLKLKKLTPWVLNILRMGVYQIYYMDKIPHSAACNEAVKLARKFSHSAASGFVNGVLRTASREKDSFSFPVTGDAVADLSLKYSYPEWITKALTAEYGAKRTEELYVENMRSHGIAVRVNRLKTTAEELVEKFAQEGLEAEFVEGYPDALIVRGKLNVDASAAYKEGLYSLQNLSSQKAVLCLDPKPGSTVIDMCAAPGGKSCAIAERMENKGKVLSFDIFEHKVELIKKAASRLGVDIVCAKVGDSCQCNEEHANTADYVLADVPCSGLGVIHKKPDIKWKRKPEDVDELLGIQYRILENAGRYVKPGGTLVYSTCTILPEENRLMTERFLREHMEFKKEYEEQILTSELGESGFYICKMLKG